MLLTGKGEGKWGQGEGRRAPTRVTAVGVPPTRQSGGKETPQRCAARRVCVRLCARSWLCVCVRTRPWGMLHPMSVLTWCPVRVVLWAALCVVLFWGVRPSSPSSAGLPRLSPPGARALGVSRAPGTVPGRLVQGVLWSWVPFLRGFPALTLGFLPVEGVCKLRLRCLAEEVHALDEPQEVPRHGLLPAH